MVNSPCFEGAEWLTLFDRCLAPCSSLPILPTLAIANPPYTKTSPGWLPPTRFYLGHRWQKQGNTWVRTNRIRPTVATAALFSELCVRQLQPGEVAVLLVPNTFLAGDDNRYARHWLMQGHRLVASIQLPPEVWKVECKLGITTSILVLQRKLDETDETDYQIFMAVVEACGYDVRGKLRYQTDPQGKKLKHLDDDLPQIVREFCAFSEHNLCPEIEHSAG